MEQSGQLHSISCTKMSSTFNLNKHNKVDNCISCTESCQLSTSTTCTAERKGDTSKRTKKSWCSVTRKLNQFKKVTLPQMTAMDQQKQAVVFHDKTKHIQKQNKSCKINVKTFTEATMMKSTVQEQQ